MNKYIHTCINTCFSLHIRITEALVEADGHFKISKAKDNMEDYTKLTGQCKACVWD